MPEVHGSYRRASLERVRGDYGTATCFIPHRDEATGNPNYEPLD